MTKQNPTKHYFNAIAGKWDQIRAHFYTESLRDFVIHKAYLHPDMIVADLGAGTGFMAVGLVGRVSKVHVVDGSPAMLDGARLNLAGHNNVEFHGADITHLPFDDGALDAVFANMVLHHLPEPLEAIREMARVLRPGGRVLISNMETHTVDREQAAQSEVWSFFSRRQVRDWLEQAGLVNIVTGSVRETGGGGEDEGDTGIFYAVGTRRVSGMRDLVQKEYGAIAEQGGRCGEDQSGESSSCCSNSSSSGGSSCCSQPVISLEALKQGEVHFEKGYSIEEQSQVPAEAADFSLGCGNPIAMAGLKTGEVVVDIGSGGGLDSFLAANKVGPSGKVIGVDMTKEMLVRSRRSAKINGYTNVEFRRGDAANLPVESGSADVVMSNCVINLTEDKGKVFAEAFRVLKPGGRLEISDMVFSGSVGRELRAAAAGWSDCVTGALIEEEMLDLVEQTGFVVKQVRRSGNHDEVGDAAIYSMILSAVRPE